jgi:hypothetical protein
VSDTQTNEANMTNGQHTPGPWQDNEVGLVYGQVSHDADEAPFVADCCNNPGIGEYTSQEKANARLIATTPLLLETLRTIAGDKEICTCHTRSWYGGHHDTQCPIRIASDAITEATGG